MAKGNGAEGLKTSVINLRVLAAASAFASKEPERYYLNGVCVEFAERGATYIATDGHRLVAYRDDLQAGEKDNELLGPFIIPTPHAKPHKIGKDEDGLAKIFGTGRLTIAYMFVDVTFSPIDGTFPDWRKTVPKAAADGTLAQFNLTYLASFDKFAKALALSAPFIAHNGGAPAFVWFNDTRCVGVVMPMRFAEQIGRVPEQWARGESPYPQKDIEDKPSKTADPPFAAPADQPAATATAA